eukprot:1685399-Pyramimonas_sp.AAC.3
MAGPVYVESSSDEEEDVQVPAESNTQTDGTTDAKPGTQIIHANRDSRNYPVRHRRWHPKHTRCPRNVQATGVERHERHAG